MKYSDNPAANHAADLISDSINILGITEVGGEWAVQFEFPYTAGTVPKRWTKQVYITRQKSEGLLHENLYKWVQELREILEG